VIINGAVADEAMDLASAFSAFLDAGDAKAVAAFCQNLSEKERRTLAKPLREFQKSLRWRAVGEEDWHSFNERWRRGCCTVTPAALAVFASATTTAKFLRSAQRADVFDLENVDVAMRILTDRAPVWLPDLPAALVADLAPEGAYRLVAAVREVADVPLIPTREFVRAWSEEYRWNHNFDQLKTSILQDPWLAEVMPLVFDDEENDYLFTSWAVFRKAALAAVAEGLVARSVVLDASLRRLLRGGRTGAMQDHLAFWNSLGPTDEEVVERVASCISLLSSQNGTVARTFLTCLKQLFGAGRLDLELALEAASIAVTRSEKNIVKTTLSWLDALAAAHPERAGDIVETIAIAFGAQAPELQERAVKLVGKRGKTLGEGERERLAGEGRVYLPSDLAATLAGLLGVAAAPDASALGGAGYPEIAPYVPRPLRPPIDSPAVLVETVAELLNAEPLEAMVFERVLEAFVVFGRTDPAGLKQALEPIAEPWLAVDWQSNRFAMTPRVTLSALGAVAAGLYDAPERRPHRASVGQLWSRMRDSGPVWRRRTGSSPADFLALRVAEIGAAWGLPDLPPLVSVPTSPSGFIAPAELAARLRVCEAEGWVPLTVDLHQALLRLPEDCGERGVDASGFTSEAGLRFAAWLNEDRAISTDVQTSDSPLLLRAETARRISFFPRSKARERTAVPDALRELVRDMWNDPARCHDGSDWMACWPAIVPSRPELAAEAMLGGFGSGWGMAPASVGSAVVLAEQDGSQTATHRVIGARLVDEDAQLRASGVDAALVLASRGLLDAAALSAALAAQQGFGGTELRRLVSGLRDLANGGAAGQAWEVIAALLPTVLPPAVPKTLLGTADLLALGTEVVGVAGEVKSIAEVSALAEKKGAGAVTMAARRLAAVLGGGG
jgi:hypothetical protein